MNKLLILAALVFVSLSPLPAQGEPLNVAVSILPQEYFVQAIGRDLVNVTVMVEPGADPHVYEPKPRQMVALSEADVYMAVGVTFEEVWLDRFRAANADMAVVQCDRGVAKLPMAAHQHEGEDHDAGHEEEHHADAEHAHGHGGLDPHIWLAPSTAKIMAANIYEGLVAADPDNQATYQENHQALLADMDALDSEIRALFQDIPEDQRRFLVFHPAWGYFAHEYGLTQVPVEVEGREPSAREMAELVHHAQAENIRVIFVQPQMSEQSARTIADEIGAQVAVLDPLSGDWPGNLLAAAQAVAQAMQ